MQFNKKELIDLMGPAKCSNLIFKKFSDLINSKRKSILQYFNNFIFHFFLKLGMGILWLGLWIFKKKSFFMFGLEN